MILQREAEQNQDDQTISLLNRQIKTLRTELEQEKSVNKENQREMKKLEKDMEELGELGTNKGIML